MSIWWLVLILVAIGSTGIAFVWLIVHVDKMTAPKKKPVNQPPGSIEDAADQDVEHIFNNEFREELRNRGRLHFEKIIGENAMFLQQDLRLTTSELNEYMKTEITKTLKDEFVKYEQSIGDAKQMAIEALEKTNAAIEEQRKGLSDAVQQEADDAKMIMIDHFVSNMAAVVNHYILEAIGDQIDLSDQLEYILAHLEANKQNIVEDIRHGA
jgi:hypothetical protein